MLENKKKKIYHNTCMVATKKVRKKRKEATKKVDPVDSNDRKDNMVKAGVGGGVIGAGTIAALSYLNNGGNTPKHEDHSADHSDDHDGNDLISLGVRAVALSVAAGIGAAGIGLLLRSRRRASAASALSSDRGAYLSETELPLEPISPKMPKRASPAQALETIQTKASLPPPASALPLPSFTSTSPQRSSLHPSNAKMNIDRIRKLYV